MLSGHMSASCVVVKMLGASWKENGVQKNRRAVAAAAVVRRLGVRLVRALASHPPWTENQK